MMELGEHSIPAEREGEVERLRQRISRDSAYAGKRSRDTMVHDTKIKRLDEDVEVVVGGDHAEQVQNVENVNAHLIAVPVRVTPPAPDPLPLRRSITDPVHAAGPVAGAGTHGSVSGQLQHAFTMGGS